MDLTKNQREKMLEELGKKSERQYKTGKIIVFSIGLINASLAIVSFIMTFNIIGFFIQLALSGALIYGIRWVRYLQVINGIITALILFSLTLSPDNIGKMSIEVIVFLIFSIVYSLATAILLIKHKGVDEYFYEQNT